MDLRSWRQSAPHSIALRPEDRLGRVGTVSARLTGAADPADLDPRKRREAALP
jgi:hypothetical protein